MEFGVGDRVVVNPLRINRSTVNELEASLVICNTGMPRDSDAIIQAQASNVKHGDQRSLEATHKLKQEAEALSRRRSRQQQDDLWEAAEPPARGRETSRNS